MVARPETGRCAARSGGRRKWTAGPARHGVLDGDHVGRNDPPRPSRGSRTKVKAVCRGGEGGEVQPLWFCTDIFSHFLQRQQHFLHESTEPSSLLHSLYAIQFEIAAEGSGSRIARTHPHTQERRGLRPAQHLLFSFSGYSGPVHAKSGPAMTSPLREAGATVAMTFTGQSDLFNASTFRFPLISSRFGGFHLAEEVLPVSLPLSLTNTSPFDNIDQAGTNRETRGRDNYRTGRTVVYERVVGRCSIHQQIARFDEICSYTQGVKTCLKRFLASNVFYNIDEFLAFNWETAQLDD
ncbi:hypothetical protein J6590_009996 [Homalodisca vitripennis]|nr:hypothetical protein J6590_009996 [Homalodisca vitripennis]